MRGENVQGGLSEPVDCFFSLLIDEGIPSLGHRDNIVNREFSNIGVGIVDAPDEWKIWVFDFGS